MTRERYKPEDNKFISWDKVETSTLLDQINDAVGVEVPIQKWIDGEPVIDSEDLPDGVTMSDVKQAVRDNHPRG